jgi:hypothetical protein
LLAEAIFQRVGFRGGRDAVNREAATSGGEGLGDGETNARG